MVPALKTAGGGALEARARQGLAALASKNWTARRKPLVEQISKQANTSPIDPDWLALQVVEAMPENAILVDEGLTSRGRCMALRPHRDRYGYHALASGGIGWGLPASVGVSLANPDRPVVCYSGDGSAMYSIQALWTAAHQKLPLTVVIVNNGGYRIIKQRLLAFHGDDHYVGMDFIDPPVDFTGVARALGLEAIRVTDPTDLKPALSSAFNRPGAKLIEVVVRNSVRSIYRRSADFASKHPTSGRRGSDCFARCGAGSTGFFPTRYPAAGCGPSAAHGRHRTVFPAAFPSRIRSCTAHASSAPAPACRRYPRNRRARWQTQR